MQSIWLLTVALTQALLMCASIQHFVAGAAADTCNAPIESSHPAVCPRNPEIFCTGPSCIDTCLSDKDCRGPEKCCPTEVCGNHCLDICGNPIETTKKGNCPPPDDHVCFWCFDKCISDNDCSGDAKCCLQPGCGNECKVAV